MTGIQAQQTCEPQAFADANPARQTVTTAHTAGPGVARRDQSAARIGAVNGPRPTIPVTGGESAGSGARVDVAMSGRLWDALARARAEYDPRVLDAAESAVVTLYLPVAHELARACSPGQACCIRACEQALIKAVRCWPQPDRPWGFEEYARGAIDAEIRGSYARHRTVGQPTLRSVPPADVPPAVSSVQYGVLQRTNLPPTVRTGTDRSDTHALAGCGCKSRKTAAPRGM